MDEQINVGGGLSEEAVGRLRQIFGERLTMQEEKLREMSDDLWLALRFKSQKRAVGKTIANAVVSPVSVMEAAELVQLAGRYSIPIIARGGGSGVCGALVPLCGGIIADMTRLKSITRIDVQERFVIAEAGMAGNELEAALDAVGYTTGHSPASLSISTPAGWVALRSKGQFSSIYGTIEDLVLAVEAIDGSGNITYVAGEDLNKFFRMQGTTGIITKVKMKIFPKPSFMDFYSFRFSDMSRALEAVQVLAKVIAKTSKDGNGLCLRLYDPLDAHINDSIEHKSGKCSRYLEEKVCLHPAAANRLVNIASQFRGLKPLLIVMVAAHDKNAYDVIKNDIYPALGELEKLGADNLGPERAQRWHQTRFKLDHSQVLERFDRGIFLDTFDVNIAVPKAHRVYEAVRNAMGRHALVMAHISHVLDNRCCIYFTFAGKGKNIAETEKMYGEACRAGLEAAAGLGASVVDHHGIGLRNKAYIQYAYEKGWYGNVKQYATKMFNPGKF